MATSGPTSLPSYFNTDADFRSYCQGIATALAAIGLVQTSDTGQINNTTVSKPSATNTAQGYEIWRFADSLQSSKPIYIKVEYGSGGAADRPSLWITTGTATNGAGTLSGNGFARQQVQQGNSQTAGSTLSMYASGIQGANDARATLFASVDTASAARAHGFHIERTLDTGGVPTSDGYYVLTYGGGTVTTQVCPHTGALPSSSTNPHTLPIGGYGSKTVNGTDTAMAPVFCVLGKITPLHLLVYNDADLGALASAAVNMYGGSHTCMPLGAAVKTTNLSPNTAQNLAAAMMWE